MESKIRERRAEDKDARNDEGEVAGDGGDDGGGEGGVALPAEPLLSIDGLSLPVSFFLLHPSFLSSCNPNHEDSYSKRIDTHAHVRREAATTSADTAISGLNRYVPHLSISFSLTLSLGYTKISEALLSISFVVHIQDAKLAGLWRAGYVAVQVAVSIQFSNCVGHLSYTRYSPRETLPNGFSWHSWRTGDARLQPIIPIPIPFRTVSIDLITHLPACSIPDDCFEVDHMLQKLLVDMDTAGA